MGLKPFSDCLLYAFIDSAYLDGREPAELARQLCDGGADVIQLRAKNAAPQMVKGWAEDVLPTTTSAGVHLVINDHAEVARAVGASCLHLGQEDFFDAGYHTATEVTRGELALGLSTHAPDQCLRAINAGPDYVAIGPVFPTGTKPGREAVTLEYVRWAATEVRLPWFAIGGIHLGNLDSVLDAGARRICVVSAILKSPSPARACAEFRERIAARFR